MPTKTLLDTALAEQQLIEAARAHSRLYPGVVEEFVQLLENVLGVFPLRGVMDLNLIKRDGPVIYFVERFCTERLMAAVDQLYPGGREEAVQLLAHQESPRMQAFIISERIKALVRGGSSALSRRGIAVQLRHITGMTLQDLLHAAVDAGIEHEIDLSDALLVLTDGSEFYKGKRI